jgi:demethylmenaquinone methyltransferase/2-methoxy-6-polyprenyl-1,4-benzoquinol methylase
MTRPPPGAAEAATLSAPAVPDPRPAGWDDHALRWPHTQPDKAARVEAMFDAIAPTYERVNRLASLGRDAAWRWQAVAAAQPRPGDVVLDLCCGTGDMVRGFARAEPRVRLIIGVDFSAGMLARGDYRGVRTPVVLLRSDVLRLPLANGCVDVVSCAFGVRNFDDLQAGLREIFRVARPAARVVILEFATPEIPVWRRLYQLYCDVMLPRLAAWISPDRTGAYRYLPRSIRTFERAGVMVRRLEAAGFSRVKLRRMNLGGVVLYRCEKPTTL